MAHANSKKREGGGKKGSKGDAYNNRTHINRTHINWTHINWAHNKQSRNKQI